MRTPARVKNHPIHPMVIPFPLALWGFSFAADMIYLFSGRKKKWRNIAKTAMGGGIVSALGAAAPGFIDYLSLKDEQVKNIATAHMLLNLSGVAAYSLNWQMRKSGRHQNLPIAMSGINMILLVISGWLGGSMVYEHKVGVVESEPRPEVRSSAS